MIRTENSEYIFDLQKRILELKQHVQYVDDALFLLRRRFNQVAINELISLGYHGIYNFDDHVQYLRQLDRVQSLCKTRVMDLYDLQQEYDKYTVNQTDTRYTEEAFEEWMADLGRFQHYPINRVETMVTQLAGIINSYIKVHKSSNKQSTYGE